MMEKYFIILLLTVVLENKFEIEYLNNKINPMKILSRLSCNILSLTKKKN